MLDKTTPCFTSKHASRRAGSGLLLALAIFALSGCVEELDLQNTEREQFACLDDSDCLGEFVCVMRDAPYGYGVCTDPVDIVPPDPICADGIKSGDESDTDCGGSVCDPCGTGQTCGGNTDCGTNRCVANVCELKEVGSPCEVSRECLTGYCGSLDGTKVCGESCKPERTCASSDNICIGTVCVPADLCAEQSPGFWVGPACDCGMHCGQEARCADKANGVICECPPGLEPEGTTCVNINECASPLGNPCDSNASCTDTDGSFTCECTAPWEGDGMTCTCPEVVALGGPDIYQPEGPYTGVLLTPAEEPPPGTFFEWRIVSTFPSEMSGTGRTTSDGGFGAFLDGEYGAVYRVEWAVSNGCSDAIDFVEVSFDHCNGERSLEGPEQAYAIAPHAGGCWMLENLNEGEEIPAGMQTDNGVTEKSCYNDSTAACDGYGGLYARPEATEYNTSLGGICPPGWLIPTEADYLAFMAASGFELMALGEAPEATNGLGLNVRLAGHWDGAFVNQTANAYHWTREACGAGVCPVFKIYSDGTIDPAYPLPDTAEASLRCIRDNVP